MNDNIKSCSNCSHFQVSYIFNRDHEICTREEFRSWDFVRGFGNTSAHSARSDENLCGEGGSGFEKQLNFRERFLMAKNWLLFFVSLMVSGLGIAMAIEGMVLVGGGIAIVFGCTAIWYFGNIPDRFDYLNLRRGL